MPGWRSRDTDAKRARKGVCTRNDSVAASSVGGLSSIVSRRAFGSREIAANVVAISPNQRACTSATGAAWAAAASSPGKKFFSSVFGSDRLRITGSR